MDGTPRIVIVGDVMLDVDVHYSRLRQSAEGDFPIVREASREQRLGGAGAVAAMVAALGAEVQLFGTIGADRRQTLHDLLRPYGGCMLNTWGRSTVKTRHWLDGERVMRADSEECRTLLDGHADQLLKRLPERADAVLVSDYGKGVVTPWVVQGLRERYPETPIIADPARGRPLDLYRGVTALVPNRQEAREHGIEAPIDAIRRMLQLGIEVMVLKRDRDGVLVVTREGQRAIPASCPEPVDVCGAGDQFLAMLGMMVAVGFDWPTCAANANFSAGLKCGKRGATPVTLAELEASALTTDGPQSVELPHQFVA